MSAALASGRAHSLLAEGVGVDFDGVHALQDVSVTARQGEILGLIGPNGAGKTTLLNVLSGFQRPGTGRVLLGDRDITSWSPQRRARAGIGRTFQAVRAFPALTVRENVETGALGAGATAREARRRAVALLDAFELSAVAEVEAGALPYGAERRLGIARALAGDPSFLLLDEPAAGLNEAESEELMHAIRRIRDERRCGIVVIEHDMRLIMSLCERIHVLDYGRTLAIGLPDEVRANPAVIEAYLGTPAHA